ncbi:hypothetical protein [Vibrio parahaemolyticus]|uniref:hypothetical protein n=1 Tax=Vibrio parahaemolyticus TaxID=670 RepID=UPI002F2BA4D8
MEKVYSMALGKVENKVSLNIKIAHTVDARLKRARAEARKQGMKFNVSAEVESFLLKELKKVEKLLSIEQDINKANNQLDLVEESKTKKVEK